MTKTPIKLQDLRRKIYTKAKADKAWRFWGLYVHVCKWETLHEAYLLAKKNNGAPGIDGVNEGRMKIDFAAGMKPEAVAARVLRALERNRPETIMGRDARLLLALNRFLPRLVDRLMARKVRRLYAGG